MNKLLLLLLVTLLLLSRPGGAVLGQQSGDVPAQGSAQEKSKPSPQSLSNSSIVKLVQAGLGEDTIISLVDAQPGHYSLGVDDIVALKKAGVSDKVIAAMLNKTTSARAKESTTSATGFPARLHRPLRRRTTDRTPKSWSMRTLAFSACS
jgi:hypothetical protein